MPRVACPYCYERIDDDRLAFRCLGHGAPGGDATTCRPALDPTRQKLTGYAGPSNPVFRAPGVLRSPRRAKCSSCGGGTGARACPECHTPLPTTFVGSSSPLIGLVGGKGAGKTVYLTVLDHELRANVRKPFDADVRPVGDEHGGDSTTAGLLASAQRALFDDGELLEQTAKAVDGRKEPVVLQWRQPYRSIGRERHRTTLLSFYDTAGEDLTDRASVESQRYLGAADGLIVLLDPWQLAAARDQLDVPDAAVAGAEAPLAVLTQLTEALRAAHGVRPTKRIRRPVAVVFAKLDALFDTLEPSDAVFARPRKEGGYDDADGQAVHESIASLLRRLGADEIDSQLRANYADFRYFGVSALGSPPDYKSKEVDPGGVRPFRVEDPLLWLLWRKNVIERLR
ncbi:TRAFAC clade GTPase domain-containing protein [Actinomycetospora atypica]|uniref:Zinc ribbon domain-containing protein n=1 Tax=Actinomycetospora atypica TaxID=1290095 RepID=A0ABV9YMJ6_9PSEU